MQIETLNFATWRALRGRAVLAAVEITVRHLYVWTVYLTESSSIILTLYGESRGDRTSKMLESRVREWQQWAMQKAIEGTAVYNGWEMDNRMFSGISLEEFERIFCRQKEVNSSIFPL